MSGGLGKLLTMVTDKRFYTNISTGKDAEIRFGDDASERQLDIGNALMQLKKEGKLVES